MIPRRLPPVHSPLDFPALLSGWRALGGNPSAIADLRSEIQARYNPHRVILTDSGTSALAQAIMIANAAVPDRPRVALPAWACYDLATALDLTGLRAVPYDLDPATLGPDWDSFDRALARGVSSAVVVHAYGVMVDLDQARYRAQATNTILIEDAAQAIGSQAGTSLAGSFGQLGVLSFGRGKGWTGGGGGALLLNSDVFGADCGTEPTGSSSVARQLNLLVKLTAQWMLARPSLYAIPAALPFLQLGKTVYRQVHSAGPMQSLEASVILATRPRVESETAIRRKNAARLAAVLASTGAGWVPEGWERSDAGCLRLPFLPNPQALRRLSQPEAGKVGILPAYPIPLYRLPGFSPRVDPVETEYRGAEDLSLRLHTLPVHGQLEERDLARLEAWIRAR